MLTLEEFKKMSEEEIVIYLITHVPTHKFLTLLNMKKR